MSSVQDFGHTQNLEITVLVDNMADLLVQSTAAVQRFTDEPLLAEHGFAAIVDLKDAGVRILWDAGITQIALLENARRMKVDLATIDKIALSHGHLDHYAAMTAVIREIAGQSGPREWEEGTTAHDIDAWLQQRRVPLVAHPAAFRERWGIDKDGKKHGPRIVPRAEWEAAGADVILSAEPYQLGPGCWTTGAVPRHSFERSGTPPSMAYREGEQFIRDYMDDDQSIVIRIKGRGLVVLTGCAHSGIVNTVNHARKISGEDRLVAVLGGFHLARADDDEIDRTIDHIVQAGPEVVAPSHCTGFKAMARFAHRMPDQFILGTVGTKYRF